MSPTKTGAMDRSIPASNLALRQNFLDKIVVENLPDIHVPGPHVFHIFSKSRSNNSIESYLVAIATDVEVLWKVAERDRDGCRRIRFLVDDDRLVCVDSASQVIVANRDRRHDSIKVVFIL